MSYVKLSNKDYMKITLTTNECEREAIDNYFKTHPALKKGETIKNWILNAILSKKDIQSGKTQVDPEIIQEKNNAK
ncbi:MAG: hypothetical protein PQJ46_01915 [Spirochaetales bacterium]|nr:hypothetical protein [Spirochaetales bacterium]